MKHLHTFSEFVNESINEAKKAGTGEIAVIKTDRPKVEKIMKGMKLDYVNVGAKDSSSMNYYEIPNADFDLLNKIGNLVDLQSMTVFESSVNEASVQVAGKSKPSGAKVLATVIVEHMMKEQYLKPGAESIKNDLNDVLKSIENKMWWYKYRDIDDFEENNILGEIDSHYNFEKIEHIYSKKPVNKQ